jgi:hypothetical protein
MATVREISARLHTGTLVPPVMMSMAGKKGSMKQEAQGKGG